MQRYAKLLTGILAGLALILIGCSDDNGSGGNLQTGDVDDAGFQFVEDNVGEEALGSFEKTMTISFLLIDSVPDIPAASRQGFPSGQATTEYLEISGIDSLIESENWFIFWFEARVIEDLDTTWIAGVDSLQFQLLGVPVDPRQSDFNGLLARAHVQAEGTTAFQLAAHHRLDMVENLTEAAVEIDGTARDTIFATFEDQSASCEFELTNSVTITDLLVPDSAPDTACPDQGRIEATATLALACVGQGDSGLEQLDINGSWTIIAEANGDGTITITYSDGTTVWTVTESNCDDEGSVGI